MITTEIILAHWRSITPAPDVAFHEEGFRRVIEDATRPVPVPIEHGDDIGVEQ